MSVPLKTVRVSAPQALTRAALAATKKPLPSQHVHDHEWMRDDSEWERSLLGFDDEPYERENYAPRGEGIA